MLKYDKIRCFILMQYTDDHISRKIFSNICIEAMIKTEETQIFGPSWSARVFKGENWLLSAIAHRWIGRLTLLYDGPEQKLFILVGWDQRSFVCCFVHRDSMMIFFCFRFPMVLFGRPGISICHVTLCIC